MTLRRLTALLSLMIVLPAAAFAAEEDSPATQKMLNPYLDQGKAVVARTNTDAEKYNDRWYEWANERYGITLERPAADDAAKTDDSSGSEDAKDVNPVGEAKALFKLYDRLEKDFSPKVADLYADDAVIKNTRTYPTGDKKQMQIAAADYKALIRKAVPLAKERGDTNEYSKVTYAKEGDGVRIKATRHSNLKDYDSPLSLLVEPDDTGTWLITEEISESQP